MRSFKFFFLFALAFIAFFWVAKLLFLAFIVATVFAFGAFLFRSLRRLSGQRDRHFPARHYAEPLDSWRQPYTSEPIAPRVFRGFEGRGETRRIEIQ